MEKRSQSPRSTHRSVSGMLTRPHRREVWKVVMTLATLGKRRTKLRQRNRHMASELCIAGGDLVKVLYEGQC